MWVAPCHGLEVGTEERKRWYSPFGVEFQLQDSHPELSPAFPTTIATSTSNPEPKPFPHAWLCVGILSWG